MRKIILALAVALVLGLSATASAQRDADYAFDLPQGWERESFVDGAQIKRTEYVYGDRSSAMLKVKKVRIGRGETVDSVVERELTALRFLPGFAQGRSEPFTAGALSGQLVQFDFNRGGKPMMGRHYYLAGGDSALWVLQFTGDRSTLGGLRNVTDQMARSFREQ
jgi:hypothetical protein